MKQVASKNSIEDCAPLSSADFGPLDMNVGLAAAVQPPRSCLLILGMHRSGTSALCGVLHQLGAARPVREMPPQPDNEKGFFEPIAISAIHDRMLASAGLYWFDWEAMPRAWYDTAAYQTFVDELVEAANHDFPSRGPFLLKDPRVCRFADVWLDALKRIAVHPVVIVQYRHPSEVAQSLKARDGFSLAHGLLMWLRHIIEAENATRNTERSFVNFTNLLVDWQSELASTIGSTWVKLPKRSARAMAMAGDFLDVSLRHQSKKANTTDTTLHPWFAKSFEALEQLRLDSYDPTAMRTLDAVRAAFDVASDAFSPAFQQLLLHVDNLGRAAGRVASVDTALASTRDALAAVTPLAERLPLVEAELAETRQISSVLQALADRVPSLEAELEMTRHMNLGMRAAADRVPVLEAELESARQTLSVVQPTAERAPILEAELEAAWHLHVGAQAMADQIPGLRRELERAHHAEAALQPLASRVPDLEAELERSIHALAAIRPASDRVPGLELDLETTRHELATIQSVAVRVPELEAALAAALRHSAEIEIELHAAKLKLDKTIARRLSAIAKFIRRN